MTGKGFAAKVELGDGISWLCTFDNNAYQFIGFERKLRIDEATTRDIQFRERP